MPTLSELNDELAALEVQHEHLMRLKSAAERLEDAQSATTEATEAAGAAIEHSQELAETLGLLTVAIEDADFPSLIGRMDEHVREIEGQLNQTKEEIETTVDQLKDELETYQEGATERLERFRNKLDAVDNRAISINQAVQNALSRLETVERHVQDDLKGLSSRVDELGEQVTGLEGKHSDLSDLVAASHNEASQERQHLKGGLTEQRTKIEHALDKMQSQMETRQGRMQSKLQSIEEQVEAIYKFGTGAVGLILALLAIFLLINGLG